MKKNCVAMILALSLFGGCLNYDKAVHDLEKQTQKAFERATNNMEVVE